MNRSVRSVTLFAITSLALTGSRPVSAQLTLQAGSGPATLAANNFGPTKTQVLSAYQFVYGSSASSGFVYQTGQTSSAVNILVAYNADGSSGLYLDSRVPVFDGTEDSTVGILNRSNAAITTVVLRAPGSGLADFDGDGPDASSANGTGMTTIVPPTPTPTGYEGPTSVFTVIPSNLDVLTINFVTPIPIGGSAFFFVENFPQPIVNGINGPGGGVAVSAPTAVPEPSGLFLMTTCAAVMLGCFRRIKSRSKA